MSKKMDEEKKEGERNKTDAGDSNLKSQSS